MSRRTRNLRLALLLALVASLAGGLLSGVIMLYGRDQLPLPLIGLIFAIILVVMFAGMLPWWRKLDHMERDGQLISWYWGGSFGGGFGLLLLMLLDRGSSQLLMGGLLIWAAQAIGFVVALIGWKIAHRSAES